MAAVRDDTQRHRWCMGIACLEACHLISMRTHGCSSVEGVLLIFYFLKYFLNTLYQPGALCGRGFNVSTVSCL